MTDPRVVFLRGTGLPFVEGERLVHRFESLLLDHKVKIAPGSKLEEIALTVTEYLALQRREITLDPRTDRRDQWLRMLGLLDLVRKLLAAGGSKRFARLVPHLRLFSTLTADPSQNAPTHRDDDANHKLFELLIAAAAERFCDDLFIEGPKAHSTTTPDLTVESDGRRWGVACKVLHSDKTTTYRDRVLEAIEQIDRADVDKGIVLINVKALAPVDEFLPFGRKSKEEPYEVYETDEAWGSHVKEFLRRLVQRMAEERQALVDAFRGSKAEPVVAHYLQSMVLRRRDGEPRMTPFVTLGLSEFHADGQDLSPEANRFLGKLAFAIQWGQTERFVDFADRMPTT